MKLLLQEKLNMIKLIKTYECGFSFKQPEKENSTKFFAEDIINALKQLNFLDVRFEAEFEEKNPDSTGTDNVRFMISTNPGEDMKPLAKIASGGELSRIMLAIKSVMAETDVSKTLIFDEIDRGNQRKDGTACCREVKYTLKNSSDNMHYPSASDCGNG